MTNTLEHADYCDGNHKSGEYFCKDEKKHRDKTMTNKEKCCSKCQWMNEPNNVISKCDKTCPCHTKEECIFCKTCRMQVYPDKICECKHAPKQDKHGVDILSLCPHCHCMTKIIGEQCGKCGGFKAKKGTSTSDIPPSDPKQSWDEIETRKYIDVNPIPGGVQVDTSRLVKHISQNFIEKSRLKEVIKGMIVENPDDEVGPKRWNQALQQLLTKLEL